jgi:hypothetical protein
MPIKLSIEIESPLTPDDRDLLSGVAVMTLAIANRELAQQGFPGVFPDEFVAEEGAEMPLGCGVVDPDQPDAVCVSARGHRGRHEFRVPFPAPDARRGLAN